MPVLNTAAFQPDATRHPFLAKLVRVLGGPQVPMPLAGSVGPDAVGLVRGELSSTNPDNLSYLVDVAKSSLPRTPQMLRDIAETAGMDVRSGAASPSPAGTHLAENSQMMRLINLLARSFYGAGGVENK